MLAAVIALIILLFPTPHNRTINLTKTLLIDTTGTFMYAVHPGLEEMHQLTDLKREAGSNQRHKIKVYVSSTEDVRVRATTSYRTEYDNLGKVHNYEFYSQMTPWVQIVVSNPSVGGSGKSAQIVGQIDVYYVYDEPTTESAGLLPWWMP
jgi:hypothetical protein